MNIIEGVYKYLPISMQNLSSSLYGYIEKKNRLGGKFSKYYTDLKKTEWWDIECINEFQEKELRKIILYCYNNIPYYKKVFDDNFIRPEEIRTKDDLKKIPVLDKETVRENYNDLINLKINGKLIHGHTSGSTGKSLQLLFTQDAIQMRWALWFRHKARFGINPDDPYATFTGKVAVPINQKKPPYWRENRTLKQTVFTMHHMSEDKIESIVDRLNRGGFAYYTGYPSILYSCAQLISERGLEITQPPNVIFTGAEYLLDNQRDLIGRVFKCFVTDQYGFSEGCGNASRCESDYFHEDFEYGILECYNPIENEDGSITGEILATGFTNLAMPLLRYRVGDTATWVNTKCNCGRHSTVIKEINGRTEDYVITPEGNKILRFDYIFKDTDNVLEAQVVQKVLGEIIIRVVKRDGYNIKDEENISKEVYSKISPSLKVKFEYINEIEREATGKFRAVKSYL